MKNELMKSGVVLVLLCVSLVSCQKNETRYYSDDDNKGLSVFSNTGNNIFTCYVNGIPWRTINRTCCGFLSGTTSEIFIRQQNDSSHNMLVIVWLGNFQNNTSSLDNFSLNLYIPANFTYRDFNKLQGTRIAIDSTTGYFSTTIAGTGGGIGTGSIYFNKASLDSTATGNYTGSFSGLLEATFFSGAVTKGRFDHDITSGQIIF